MARLISALALLLVLAACSAGDAVRVARIAATRDVTSAGAMAAEKTARYAANPEALARDIRTFSERLKRFREAVRGVWGGEEAEEPRPKVYVKYVDNYLSRALVDFDRGLVTVESLDETDPPGALKKAIVTTVLAPRDPRAVDLYSASRVKLGAMPFLYGEVRDFEGENIRWQWRAERFAEELVERRLRTRLVDAPRGKAVARYVRFEMVPDHLEVRAAKYGELVTSAAARFGLSRNMIFAVIKTESDFNPYAVSEAPAFGLMQIVPEAAGSEVREYLSGDPRAPSPDFLMDPANNILYGAAYLHLLWTRHMAGVADPVSREFLSIAAYNTGPGNALRVFNGSPGEAVREINSMSAAGVYRRLKDGLPYAETRRYLDKVLAAKKDFVRL